MTIFRSAVLFALLALLGNAAGCNQSASESKPDAGKATTSADTHTHADGSTHGEHEHEDGHAEEDHAHDEVSLGSITIDSMTIELAQRHGAIEAGKEGHLVVKLPYTDNGATIVRAWIGTEDRTLSFVGKGDYAASPDDYDVHAVAPDPLPDGAMWWIEIEKPDGSKHVGSAKPMTG